MGIVKRAETQAQSVIERKGKKKSLQITLKNRLKENPQRKQKRKNKTTGNFILTIYLAIFHLCQTYINITFSVKTGELKQLVGLGVKMLLNFIEDYVRFKYIIF